MLSIDLFCAADDQHRVKLLAEVLGEAQQALQSGQTVTLRAGPVAEPSDPCLVACTARALRAPWIQALFRTDHTVVAVRLDDTPLPGPCTRITDIQSWPARSADSEVEALAVWLQNLTDDGTDHAPLPAGAAPAERAPDPPGRARPSSRHRVRAVPGRSDLKRGLLLLGLVVVGLGLLWVSAQRQAPASGEHAEQRSGTIEAAPGPGVSGADPLPAGSAGHGSTGHGSTGPASIGPGSAADSGAVAGSVAVNEAAAPPLPAPPPALLSAPLPIPAAATAAFADAVEHLCRAETPAAARAWAGVLNWKQQRRAAREPCVRELAARPGFEALEALLDLS